MSSDFTFIITAYNPGIFVEITIKSILNQTYSNFNILYIDDNSTDNSVNLLESINDTRIRIIKNRERIGLIPCLNLGIDLSTSKYIIRFDSDDILLPNFLQNKIENLEEDIILLGDNILITDNNLNIKSKTRFPTSDLQIKKQLLRLKSSVNQPGVLLERKSVIKAGYYNPVKASEDYDLWLRMIKLGKFKNTNCYQLLYRVTGNSLTNTTFEHIAKSNIEAISCYEKGILETKSARIYIFLFKKYNHIRGFSLLKLIYYPIYTFYRLFYSKLLTCKYFKA
jgi:glycosyltransferase involved in cell wall biosynthesis